MATSSRPWHPLALLGFILLLLPTLPAAAQSDTGTQILYHEAVSFLRQQSAVANKAQAEERWSFSAMGRDFNLILTPNTRLISALTRNQTTRLPHGTRLFSGRVQGHPNSWVRLTESAHGTSALIYDGDTMYAIEPHAAVAPSLSIADSDSGDVFYPLSQVYTAPMLCATSATPIGQGTNVQAQLDSVVDSLAIQAAANRSLDLAVYIQDWSGDVFARLNAVDGIFTQQLGITLNVVSVATGVYTTFGTGNELQEFRNNVVPANGTNTANHLFTSNTNAVSWAGIAQVGRLCAGSGISKMIGNLAAEVTLVAHELGHNFGARHDGQASGCPAVPNAFIMWPSVNRTTSFSNCSIAAMQGTIAASLGQCLSDIGSEPVTLSLSTSSVNESAGSATVQINLSRAVTVPVEVTVFTRPQTAQTGVDFYGKSQRVRIAAGATSATFTVTILNDNNVEGAETFQVRMADPSNAVLASNTASVTIIDDDQGGAPTLTVRTTSVVEGNRQLAIPVDLNMPSSNVVTVTAFTRSGSAQTGRDFYGATQTLRFTPGTTRQFLRVDILDDNIAEGNETFQARLVAPTGASIGTAVANIRINDNDGTTVPTLSIASPTVPENAGSVSVGLSLSRSSTSPVRATVFTRVDSAREGTDYYGQTRVIEFQPGQTQAVFTVTILDDATAESVERFRVLATAVQGANPQVTPGTVTVLDND